MKKKSSDLLVEYTLETGASNPVLRTNCDTITRFDNDLRQLAEDMSKLMRLYYGTGLAAPQIGFPIRLITTIQWREKNGKLTEIGETVLVNPRIVEESKDTIPSEESCLSLPNLEGVVERKKRVIVEYQDIYGQHKVKEFIGYNATVVQHEIDHINGILFIDRLMQKQTAKHRQLTTSKL